MTLLQRRDLIRFRTDIDCHYYVSDFVQGVADVYYISDKLQDMHGQFRTRELWRRFTPHEWQHPAIITAR